MAPHTIIFKRIALISLTNFDWKRFHSLFEGIHFCFFHCMSLQSLFLKYRHLLKTDQENLEKSEWVFSIDKSDLFSYIWKNKN